MPRWLSALLTALCIGLMAVGLAGLVGRPLLARRARADFEKLAAQAQSGAEELPPGQAPAAYRLLQEQNPDFVGWVQIEGTALNYPVMQTKGEPEYYLRRDFDGEWSPAGTPFLDARCDMEEGAALILYGHHMRDGAMFAAAAEYLEERYFQAHPVLRCDSLTRRREYEVMAVLHLEDSPETAANYYALPKDQGAFEAWVERILAGALYDTGVRAQWGDQLLILSTCDEGQSTGRVFVAARLAGEAEEAP